MPPAEGMGPGESASPPAVRQTSSASDGLRHGKEVSSRRPPGGTGWRGRSK